MGVVQSPVTGQPGADSSVTSPIVGKPPTVTQFTSLRRTTTPATTLGSPIVDRPPMVLQVAGGSPVASLQRTTTPATPLVVCSFGGAFPETRRMFVERAQQCVTFANQAGERLQPHLEQSVWLADQAMQRVEPYVTQYAIPAYEHTRDQYAIPAYERTRDEYYPRYIVPQVERATAYVRPGIARL